MIRFVVAVWLAATDHVGCFKSLKIGPVDPVRRTPSLSWQRGFVSLTFAPTLVSRAIAGIAAVATAASSRRFRTLRFRHRQAKIVLLVRKSTDMSSDHARVGIQRTAKTTNSVRKKQGALKRPATAAASKPVIFGLYRFSYLTAFDFFCSWTLFANAPATWLGIQIATDQTEGGISASFHTVPNTPPSCSKRQSRCVLFLGLSIGCSTHLLQRLRKRRGN